MNIDITISALYVFTLNLVIMMYLSPELTGWTMLSMSPICLMCLFYANCMRYFGKVTMKAKKDLSNTATESFINVRTVKTFANEDEECSKYMVENMKVQDISVKK